MRALLFAVGVVLVTPTARADEATYWAEPRGDYEGRRRAALEHAAAAPPGLNTQIARLALGRPIDEAAIRAAVTTVSERRDGADFAANGLLRVHAFASPLVPEKLRGEIKQALTGFRYWMDEPAGGELLWMWNENHMINYFSAQHLAGQFFPDEIFRNNGKPGRWHQQKGRERLLRWIALKAKTGFAEWDSNNCYVSIIAALLNVAELATDAELARRAAMLLDVMFFDMAIDSYRGTYGSAHGRTYPDGIVAGGLKEATTGLMRLAFGMGNPGGPNNSAVNYLAASKRYRVARTVELVAGLMPEELVNRERQSLLIAEAPRFGLSFDDPLDFFLLNQAGKHASLDLIERSTRVMAGMPSALWAQVTAPYATALAGTYRALARQGRPVPDLDRASLARVDKITYRTPDYQLSAAQDYRKGAPGSMQQIWQATLGPATMVFTLHPGPSTRHWLGRLPRVAQHANLLFAVHELPAAPYPGPKVVVPPGAKEFFPSPAPADEVIDPRVLAVFRRASFDEVIEERGWIFARKGAGYLALWSRQPVTWSKDGVFGGEGLEAKGHRHVFVCHLGRQKVDGPFAAWRARIAAAPISATDAEVTYQAPGIGPARFGWEGPLRVNGRAVPLAGYPRFDNPYTRTAYGQDRYVITGAGRRLLLDFKRNQHRDEALD